MSQYKQCSNGHYYEGDVCPYCKTRLYPDVDTPFNPTLTGDPDGLYQGDCPKTIIVNMPICPYCGEHIRKNVDLPTLIDIGSIDGNASDGKVPWNYGWNGKCDNCGHNFAISMTQRLHSPEYDRKTILKSSSRRIFYGSADQYIGLSGIEIEQYNSTDGIKRTFISTNELKYIIKALKDSLFLEQLDWNEDDHY